MVNAMSGDDTPHTILNRVRDPRDHPAWCEFHAFCDPLFRRFGKELRLDPHASDEICREAWNGLWKKMQSFEYDPNKKFRHWLWFLFRCQVLDYLKKRRREHEIAVDFSDEQIQDLLPIWGDRHYGDDSRGCLEDTLPPSDGAHALLKRVEAIQESVRSKVKESTWRAFWLVAIEEKTTEEAARSLGMTYLATYKAVNRVRNMLIAQGRIHLG